MYVCMYGCSFNDIEIEINMILYEAHKILTFMKIDQYVKGIAQNRTLGLLLPF